MKFDLPRMDIDVPAMDIDPNFFIAIVSVIIAVASVITAYAIAMGGRQGTFAERILARLEPIETNNLSPGASAHRLARAYHLTRRHPAFHEVTRRLSNAIDLAGFYERYPNDQSSRHWFLLSVRDVESAIDDVLFSSRLPRFRKFKTAPNDVPRNAASYVDEPDSEEEHGAPNFQRLLDQHIADIQARR